MLSRLRYRWCKHERWTWNRSRCFLGSIILATIAKALPLVGISSLWQNMIKGVIILVVVVINVVLQRIADKNALKGKGDVNHGWKIWKK